MTGDCPSWEGGDEKGFLYTATFFNADVLESINLIMLKLPKLKNPGLLVVCLSSAYLLCFKKPT